MAAVRSVGPVIITRPRAQAAALAQQVAACGREAVLLPLLEILPLADPQPLRAALAQLDSYALVVFVSPNAIDAAFAARPQWPQGLQLGVVGDGSRRALQRHRLAVPDSRIVQPQDSRCQDSEGLLAALDLHALRGRRVLIVRGENGREHLAQALRAAAIEVTTVAAYRRVAPALDDALAARLRQLLAADGDWILTSSEALRILLRLVADVAGSTGVSKMQQQKIIVPHARIAATARVLGFGAVTLTASGDQALLAALQFGA